MKKTLRLFALMMCLALVVTAMAACSNGSPSSTPSGDSSNSSESSQGGSSTASTEPLKFAHICPYTGDFSQYGTLQKNALLIAIEEFNEAGGVNGRMVEFEYYDDKNVATETVSIANKLIGQEDLLAVIGPFSSTCALAVAQIFAKAEIPHICITSSHSEFAKSSEWNFTGSTLQVYNQKVYAQFVYENLGIDKAAMIYGGDDVGVEVNGAFTESFEALGGKIVYSQQFVKGTTKDFKPLITAAVNAGAELINMSASYNEAGLLVTQARDLDIMIPIMGTNQTANDDFLAIVGEKGEMGDGYYAISNFGNDIDTEASKAFKEKYARYPEGLENHAVCTYDMVTLVFDGLKANADKLDDVKATRVAIRDYLTDREAEGLYGTFRMTKDGNILKPMFVLTIKDGQFVTDTIMPFSYDEEA